MKSRMKKLLAMIFSLILMLCVCGMNLQTASAAKKTSYKKLYKNFLAKKPKANQWFYVLNVDKSGVPELITTESGGGVTNFCVYTASNNKVIKVGEYITRGTSQEHPEIDYVSKYKCLYASGWINGVGGAWANLYGISKKHLVSKYHLRETHEQKDLYYIGTSDKKSKKVSKKEYLKYYNKYFNEYKSYKTKENTKSVLDQTFGK